MTAEEAHTTAVSRAAFEAWLERYGKAWEDQSPEQAVELFTEHALYYETPFDRPARGKEAILEYWRTVPEGQRDIRFRSEVIAVRGDTGYCRWCASFTRSASGSLVELDGIFAVTFDASGRCSVFREWWHRSETF